MRDLTSLDIQKLYSSLLTHGLSTGSVKNTHTMLHKALRDAVTERLIPRNYTEGAFKTRVKRREVKGWASADLRTFLDAAAEHRMYPLMRLSAMTGMRRAEVVGLRWNDVDLKNDTLHVRKTLTKANDGSELEDPKSHRGIRAIDLDPDTVLVLGIWRQAQREEALASEALFRVPFGCHFCPCSFTEALQFRVTMGHNVRIALRLAFRRSSLQLVIAGLRSVAAGRKPARKAALSRYTDGIAELDASRRDARSSPVSAVAPGDVEQPPLAPSVDKTQGIDCLHEYTRTEAMSCEMDSPLRSGCSAKGRVIGVSPFPLVSCR